MQKLDGLKKQKPVTFDLGAFNGVLINLNVHSTSTRHDFNHDGSTFRESSLPRLDFGTDPKLYTIIDRYLAIRGLEQAISKDQAGALLAAPINELECLLSVTELKRLQERMETTSRIAVGLPRSELSYSGSWYYQGLDPVCAPMAIANAAHVIGSAVEDAVLAKLFNLALPKDAKSRGGISYEKLAAVLSEQTASDLIMSDLPYDKGLKSLLTEDVETISLSLKNTFTNMPPAEERLQELRDFNSQEASKAVLSNARVIKEHLDRADVLLVSLTRSLTAPKGFEPFQTGLHTVCISGYRISDSGYMDVQLVDSHSGKYWASLEHVSSSIYPFDTQILRKAS